MVKNYDKMSVKITLKNLNYADQRHGEGLGGEKKIFLFLLACRSILYGNYCGRRQKEVTPVMDGSRPF